MSDLPPDPEPSPFPLGNPSINPEALLTVAEVLYAFRNALVAAGFTVPEALLLTGQYLSAMLTRGTGGVAS